MPNDDYGRGGNVTDGYGDLVLQYQCNLLLRQVHLRNRLDWRYRKPKSGDLEDIRTTSEARIHGREGRIPGSALSISLDGDNTLG